ncbi:protein cereblon homolog [Ceratitis capitata]|uniref:Protein cereblon n=1 Tax=Ceratitis capitata TaxID=7213 RepID=W8C8D7_CERCA|nr:protein cereblon homolog [Ceratitis capitata]
MDTQEPAEVPNTSGAARALPTEESPIVVEITNPNENIEPVSPTESRNNSVSFIPKVNADGRVARDSPSTETNSADQVSATTSRVENVAEGISIQENASEMEQAIAEIPDTLAVAVMSDPVDLVENEIESQAIDNREVEHSTSTANNMDIENEYAQMNETDNESHDESQDIFDDEDIEVHLERAAAVAGFDPSPLIEPLLVDDDMGEERGEGDGAEQQGIVEDDVDDDFILEDISDDASTSSEPAFNDDQMRAAFREMLVQNRRGGENFMQRLRSAFFTMEHNRERRRVGSENNEEEIEEPEPENPVSFDTNLPAEHSYLGENMDRVSGVHYLTVGQQYNMMLFMHQHILFPGEVLPFMISGSIIESDMNVRNGFLFGVCFPTLCSVEDADDNFYGVTCQIYEKGTDERGNTLIKSRALQRFVTKGSQVTGPLSFIAAHPQLKVYGNVRILPEIYLREPLKCIDMGSLNRFRDIDSMRETYKRYQAATTHWPAHVYEYYSITSIVEKARSQLAQHKIETMPTDPTQLSFWLVRNLHLSDSLMKTIFLTDSVNMRMKLISNTFTDDSVFTCRYCNNRIANCQQLFAMSKHGVQTQYCNSAGYIHETNTVYQLLPDAITYSGQPSAEFSWFPGYEWHIIVCKICSRHIGWKFKALEPNLVPKSFFGISSSSVRVSSSGSQGNTGSRIAVFQSLMRLVRSEMQ